MYILYMKNSKFLIDKLGKLLEQGMISTKDLSSELLNITYNVYLKYEKF